MRELIIKISLFVILLIISSFSVFVYKGKTKKGTIIFKAISYFLIFIGFVLGIPNEINNYRDSRDLKLRLDTIISSTSDIKLAITKAGFRYDSNNKKIIEVNNNIDLSKNSNDTYNTQIKNAQKVSIGSGAH